MNPGLQTSSGEIDCNPGSEGSNSGSEINDIIAFLDFSLQISVSLEKELPD